MPIGRKPLNHRNLGIAKSAAEPRDVADPAAVDGEGGAGEGGHFGPGAEDRQGAPLRRVQRGVVQFPMQILVPEETRNALRQRSEETGASIRHIILRSLAADGFPVPRLTRRR